MKKKLVYIALVLAALSGSSCNKYLDIQPVGTVIPTTEADFRALLVSAYQVFPAHKSILNLRTDELLVDEYAMDIASIKDLYLWNDQNPDPNTMLMPWETFYKTIFYANHIIAEAETKAGSSDQVKQILAEAYLLRAYTHFELVNMYAEQYNPQTSSTDAGIPISIKVDLEQTFAPATVEQVHNQILADINQAKSLMQVEDTSVEVKYRFSKRALAAFESRLHLYRGEWTLAAAAADQALAINANLEDLKLASSKLPNDFESKEMIQAWEESANATVTRSTYIDPAFLAKYAAGDLRASRYFQKSGWDYVSLKGGNNRYNVSFRNAELYLIKAEAAARTTQVDVARASLKTLLKNRLTAEAYAAAETTINTLGAADLVNYTLAERAKELALEGLYWYDLKRTSRPSIVHSYQYTDYELQQNDPRYIIRYPQEARANNPAL